MLIQSPSDAAPVNYLGISHLILSANAGQAT
jgi:hypothetical protein